MVSAVSGRCQLKCDTIRAGNQYIIAEYPAISKSYIQNYEEGFFKTIICLEDTAFITIHCGAMMNVPLTQMSDKTITSEFRLNKDIRITRGYSVKNNRRKYFREDNYFKYGVNIVYDNIDENNINKYEQYFNNIKIYRKDVNESEKVELIPETSAFDADSIVYTPRPSDLYLCSFGKALQKATGKTGKGFEAHHTLPQKHRSKFEKLGINIDEPGNVVWRETKNHRSNSKKVSDDWDTIFSDKTKSKNYTKEQILNFRNEIETKWFGNSPGLFRTVKTILIYENVL